MCCPNVVLVLGIKDDGPLVKQQYGLLSHLIIYTINILMVE